MSHVEVWCKDGLQPAQYPPRLNETDAQGLADGGPVCSFHRTERPWGMIYGNVAVAMKRTYCTSSLSRGVWLKTVQRHKDDAGETQSGTQNP